MNLADFARTLPKNWATAPIYAKGSKLPKGGIACGKSPLGRAATEKLSPEFTAQKIEERSKVFKAVGVYTGTRSDGLVIFDVDRNLGAIQEKWGEDLVEAPRVVSPKKNAAKYLFIVPEEDRLRVSGMSHAAANQEGWEVLWGGQGVLCGAYKDGGEYVFHGDPNNVPEAPEWLLERMREQYRKVHQKDSARQLKDARYANRSREEKIAIAESCLSVIEPRGAYSERFWWEIGAMIHSELPNEDGLKLWEAWSRKDAEYASDWENGGNPCRKRWENGFRGGGLGFGSLIKAADAVDPDRTRFQRDGIASLVEEIQSAPIKYKMERLSGPELLARAIELEETIEDPALLDQAKTLLAEEGGRAREGAAAIDRLLESHLNFKKNDGYAARAISELDTTPFDYLIPGLMPKPWLTLLHADGGTGKSALCMTLCRHISEGIPLNVLGQNVPIKAGRCLWLNGDQNERIVRRQFEMHKITKNVNFVRDWDMAWYRRFCKLQGPVDKPKYDLIVIDSLDGCNDSNPYEENRREYALPLKKLARNNGVEFGACAIIVIHHNNRNGGFRGTSAIKAAVDETWNMRRGDDKALMEKGLQAKSRVVSVEKSRDDREGREMVFTLLPDFSFGIGTMPTDADKKKDLGVQGFQLEVLDVFQEFPAKTPLCVNDLLRHLGGESKKRAVRHVIDVMTAQKMLEECPAPEGMKFSHRPPKFYRLVGIRAVQPFSQRSEPSRGCVGNSVSEVEIPVPGTDSIDNPDLAKPSARQKVADQGAFDTKGLLTNPSVNRIPSAAREEAFDTDFQAHRVDPWAAWDTSEPEVYDAHKEQRSNYWGKVVDAMRSEDKNDGDSDVIDVSAT